MGSEIKTSQESELAERLEKIENKLDLISGKSSVYDLNAAGLRSGEVDLRELWSILWQGKWWIISITFLFTVAGVVYALSLPNMYKSEGIYAPVRKENDASGMVGRLGGLATLAGVSLGGEGVGDIDQALVLMMSRPFLEGMIEKYNLKPLIMATKGWNKILNEVVWDEEIYDSYKGEWLVNPRWNGAIGPTDYEAYAKFTSMLSISKNSKNGMITISLEFYSPVLAQEWLNILKEEINGYFRKRDIRDANKNIEYLRQKVMETTVADMQSVFYGMIESQTKTLMLAEVGDEYLIRTVVPPLVPEVKSRPSKAIICIISVLLGGVLGMLLVLLRGLVTKW